MSRRDGRVREGFLPVVKISHERDIQDLRVKADFLA
jgi:hypothetical protein